MMIYHLEITNSMNRYNYYIAEFALKSRNVL